MTYQIERRCLQIVKNKTSTGGTKMTNRRALTEYIAGVGPDRMRASLKESKLRVSDQAEYPGP